MEDESERAKKLRLEELEREEAWRLAEHELKEKELQLKFDLEKFKFNPISRINLYLEIFERQAKRVLIEKEDWVEDLLGLLPLEIVRFIAQEPEELAENYDYVNNCIFKDVMYLQLEVHPSNYQRQLEV
ncbi:hypothetical protein TNCV_5022461 [Trichonephila clavipes]|nr:hypothetical protein TNCV_5022461 [Trichonephila clavipes]